MPNSGGSGFIEYTGLDASTGYAGVMYSGMFPDGTVEGKVVSLGFPFETIYPQDTRVEFMKGVLQFFFEPTDISDELTSTLPTEYKLYQNYPNPFNPTTTIKFTLPSPSQGEGSRVRSVKLVVYDILGNEVATLVNQNQPPGNHHIEFNAQNLSSGTYFYKLTAGNFTKAKKMILIK
jgi:hypothetical protein